MAPPTASMQQAYWASWVSRSQAWQQNPDNARRAWHVLRALDGVLKPDDRVLDIGCGTGWATLEMAKQSNHVSGLDLAADAMEALRQTHPHVEWIDGDFLSVQFPKPFRVVVSMETIAHVPDQAAFARRIAEIMEPRGTLVLTSQNPWIWNRTSWLEPPGEGQIRNWPSRERLVDLFTPSFEIRKIETCAPGGDIGLMRLVHNGIVRRAGNLLLGEERWTQWREKAGFGRSFVMVAVRHP